MVIAISYLEDIRLLFMCMKMTWLTSWEKRWAAAEKVPFSPHWKDFFKSGIHSELQIQLSLPINLNHLAWLQKEASCVTSRREKSLGLMGMLFFIIPGWLVSITAIAHLVFKSFPWTLSSFPAELSPRQSGLSLNWIYDSWLPILLSH